MRSSGRWRIRRLGVAGLLAGLALLPLLAAAPPATATDGQVTALLPATLSLGQVTPTAPQPGDTLRLSGTVSNASTATLTGLGLQLLLDPGYVGSRGEFDAYAGTPPTDAFDETSLQPVQTATVSIPRAPLVPGGSERWSIAVPIDQLALPAPWEVYRLGVVATAGGLTVGRLRTFLPYAPDSVGGGQPVQVSWLWPLVDRPHRTLAATGAVYTDDDLATALAPGGRLADLLAAARSAAAQHPKRPPARHHHRRRAPDAGSAASVPTIRPVGVTYAVDPMLLEDAQRMAASPTYTVRTADGNRPGKGRAAAAAWLGQLTSAARATSVLSLPYADPDVVAAVRHGEGQQVQEAQAYGQALTQRILSHVLTGWAWPPDGMISLSTIDALFAGGITDAVLSGANLPPIEGQPAETPNAHVPVVGRDGTLDGVLTDPTLSAVVDHGATGDSGLALQRYLSETLMIQAESPNDRRSIVIAPQRRWDPPAGYATALLQDTGRVPWLRPATLQRAISAPVDTELARTLRYPRSAARAQLSRSYLRSVAQVDGSLEAVNSILLRPTAVGQNPAKETIWAALSSAWRDHGRAAAAYLARLRSAVTDTVAQVHIASKTMSLVTLTSHSGAVPITVANDMDQPVRVRVALDAGRRLSVTGAGNSTRTIQPHERVAVDVRATANTSGTFPLIVRLLTPTGRPYGSPVRLFVRSTAYGALALLITGGALAVLFAAVVTRLVRRGLAARRASTGD